MSTKTDENADDIHKDDEGAEGEQDGAEGAEEQEEEEGADEGAEGEENEEGEEEEEGEEGDEKPEDKKAFKMPEKFKGKTPEEIAKSYTELESMIGDKALEMAQAFLTKNKKGIEAKPEDDKGDDEEFDIGLTDEEIAKMSPKEFARHLNRKITEKATKIAQEAIERSSTTKESVSREIREATKDHPHLKDNKQYRDVVLDIIEAANAKGNVVTLKEACKKADAAFGIKPGAKAPELGPDGKPKKRPKTAVEKNEGGDDKPVLSEGDKIRQGMMNAGGHKDVLGGLGV